MRLGWYAGPSSDTTDFVFAVPEIVVLAEIGCDLTILCNYGNVAPPTEPVTSGHWDEVTYDSLTDTTTFKDNSGTFPAHAIDWWVQPDAGRSTYLDIVTISASEIVVAGDATGLAHGLIQQPLPDPDIIGTFYTIVWPVGVDPATGTLAHDDPCNPASRLLFAGYYYMPPVAGTTVPPSGGSPGVYGEQPGGNLAGDYYCWNRVYDSSIGRWTSSDPAMTPWSNVREYVGANPHSKLDPSGLGNCKFVIYDNVEGGVLEFAWWAGAAAKAGWTKIGAGDWGTALTELKNAYSDESCCCIEGIQIWGHGSQGRSLLGGKKLNLTDPFVNWVAANWCTPDNEGIYFRQCEVAGGKKGKTFMEDAAIAFDAKVSGHTHVISDPSDQPGLQSVDPKGKAGWGDTEGEDSWVELPLGEVHETGRNTVDPKTERVKTTVAGVAKVALPVGKGIDLGKAYVKGTVKGVKKLWGKMFD